MTVSMSKRSMAPGSIMPFGMYPQTASGTDRTPIEWLVLDVQDRKALLLSRYGLDAKPYNTANVNATWATCTLRTWLNDVFLHYAFTSQEQMRIAACEVSNAANQGYGKWKTSGGYDTVDKIFLLSYREANGYLGVTLSTGTGSDTPKAIVHPTGYAIVQGAIEDEKDFTTPLGEAAGSWWLRSPGNNQRLAANVFVDGNLDLQPVSLSTLCVRPALWMDLSAEVF